ncbi:type III effector protein [Desulfosarcina widdelii]|uniref:Type III effector protein n=1 Tax=Desulfosarcina widdelii TaxID=947919 RepID=A0A5K7Z6M3_9BACT|nr:Hsp20/alpha crystallin family protein [Desulfosarcina widdelii]BBO74104.1 type III effector protein [Desulfosarcina widdelii]
MFDLMPHRRRSGRELVRFRDEMDSLFNRFFDMDLPISRRFFGEGDWAPRVDVVEGKDDITVQAEIPGCEVGDIDVKLDRRTLTISGEKKQEKEDKGENVHRVERSYGTFSRMLQLSADVDPKNIDATYKKGVLKLVFKKIQSSETKKIDIKSG